MTKNQEIGWSLRKTALVHYGSIRHFDTAYRKTTYHFYFPLKKPTRIVGPFLRVWAPYFRLHIIRIEHHASWSELRQRDLLRLLDEWMRP
jgi:hypothetical protein